MISGDARGCGGMESKILKLFFASELFWCLFSKSSQIKKRNEDTTIDLVPTIHTGEQ